MFPDAFRGRLSVRQELKELLLHADIGGRYRLRRQGDWRELSVDTTHDENAFGSCFH